MRLIESIVLISFILCCQSVTLTIPEIYQCSCGNVSNQNYCGTTYCNWDTGSSTCQNKPCSSFLIKDDCQGVPDPFNCVWNQTTQKCESFTKCSDYTYNVSDAEFCYDLIKCQVDLDKYDDTKKIIGCMDRTSSSAKSIAKCDGVPYTECFWLTTPDGKQCIQNTTTQKCEASTITSCGDYKIYDNCNNQACYWNDTTNACTILTCALLPKENCFLFMSVDSKSATFCQWNTATNACQDLDVSTLKDTQCLDNTLYSYIWNPDSSKCELCSPLDSPSPSSAQIISLAGILLISLFV